MKFKKMFSVLLAVCMLFTSVVYAGAAELPERERISKHAGETVSCEVIFNTENGMTSRAFEVYIPVAATKAVEEELLLASLLTTTNSIQPGDWSGSFQCISYTSNVPQMLSSFPTYACIGSGTLYNDYPTLLVQFENLYGMNYATKVNVNLQNITESLSWTNEIALNSYHDFTYFLYNRDPSLDLGSGDQIVVYGYADTGYATADSCTVYGSTQAMG